jgi:pyruvate ferredoxin oxidoreductase delta subunit
MSKKWDYKNVNSKNIPRGAVIPEAGTADDYETGGWRTKHPEVDKDKCIDCLVCYMYCPDSSVITKDGKLVGFDLKHCKGCGICAVECKKDAIKMENG